MPSLQDQFQSLLDRFVASGRERGLQLAVYHEGRLVVNAFAGVCAAESGRPVDQQTLFPVFSVGKGLVATIIHRLVERGVLSYDTPLADLWPGFDAHGKSTILLRHALNHTAGLPYMPAGIGHAELNDWPTMCAALAAAPPAWPAGTAAEYHAMTYGWLLGETARRATGKSFGELLDEEIRRPLGIEALYMGLPDALRDRAVTLEDPPIAPGPPVDPFRETAPRWVQPLGELMNRADARRACHPGFGVVLSAEAIARHYAALLPGGVDGVELLPPARIRQAIQPQGMKNAAGDPFKWLLGYTSSDEPYDPSRLPHAFGHNGHGGSFAFASLRGNFAVGFTRNLLKDPGAVAEIRAALAAAFPG